MKENYERLLREQNERRDREAAEWQRRENESRQYLEQMERQFREDRERIQKEADERVRRDEERYKHAQEERENQRRKMEEEARMVRESHEAKLREMDAKREREEQERRRLQEELKARMDENVKRTEQERQENEKRKKEVEEMLKKNEEDKKRMDEEIKRNNEKLENELRAARQKQEELDKQMKKSQEEAEERRKREIARAALQKELDKRREQEINTAKEKAEKEAAARKKAEEEREKAKDDLAKGIRPEMIPTDEEIRRVKVKLQYSNDHFHFAVCGQAGSGKSSLINALRGMRNNNPMSAKVGATETTQIIGRYPDMDQRPPRAWIVWYDIPGGGTPNIPDWQYFNDQGLYIFDLVVLAIGDRLSILDIWIIKNCQRFKVPCFVVRSKSDMHIENICKNELDYDAEDDDQDHKAIREQARSQFIEQTRKSFASVIAKERLPPQRTYIVSSMSMCNYVNGRKKNTMIDEEDLINDLLQAAYARVGIQAT